MSKEKLTNSELWDFLYEQYKDSKHEELLEYLCDALVDYNRESIEKWYLDLANMIKEEEK